ncbi:MAG: Eco57I restriction-modification methylase domain-containing protein [Candidatus Marinimicrobia bacterium]|nr:Eco57I restriction-modification methylase domain-containing protein [Candidatus Neomarinimicrobiota bacterium]
MMIQNKSAYQLSRSQVVTPDVVVDRFWEILGQYRNSYLNVLDLGAGDARFARNGNFSIYDGVEIDIAKIPLSSSSPKIKMHNTCAFEFDRGDYSACIGNPPYVRSHDLEKEWRDKVAKRLSSETGVKFNRKANLYIYFMFLSLIKSKEDGLVAVVVPYEWVSRPSGESIRKYIKRNNWNVDVYQFSYPIFREVMTTASITIIDKRGSQGIWNYYIMEKDGNIHPVQYQTGSTQSVLEYENRGILWAKRGMSPGTQKVFTLTEGERIHGGLKKADVLPCVTTLRELPESITRLTSRTFQKRFVDAGLKCWLIKSYERSLSQELQMYLGSIPMSTRDTSTCNSRNVWYEYAPYDAPDLLVSTGFVNKRPKVLINSIGARAIGGVAGIYGSKNTNKTKLQAYLAALDFEARVVPHSHGLKKIEIRQLNSILNSYTDGTTGDL